MEIVEKIKDIFRVASVRYIIDKVIAFWKIITFVGLFFTALVMYNINQRGIAAIILGLILVYIILNKLDSLEKRIVLLERVFSVEEMKANTQDFINFPRFVEKVERMNNKKGVIKNE